MDLDGVVLEVPDPRLRRQAEDVGVPDPGIARLVEQLVATMRTANGLGLAAPQIGESRRVAVVDVAGDQVVLINPRIVGRRGTQRGWEGCLSVPHLVALVDRPAEVTVEGVGLDGRPVRVRRSGLAARAITHEVDHLDGRLYVDLVPTTDLIDVRTHPTPPRPEVSTR